MGSSVILPVPGQPKKGPDPGFTQGAIPNLVSFEFQKVSPPSTLYVQRDDILVVQAVTQLATDTIGVVYRLLLPYSPIPGQPDDKSRRGITADMLRGPGYIQTGRTQFVVTPSLSVGTNQIVLTEGYLLSVAVLSLNAPVRGSTFVRAWLNRGPVVAAPFNQAALLLSDYITLDQSAGWPTGRVVSPADGPGLVQVYTPANPLAGADFSASTLNPGRVRLQGAKATFAASAAVANRFPSFQLLEQASLSVLYQFQEATAIVANQTVTYSLAPGATNVRGGGAPFFETVPIPSPFFGRAGVTVTSSTQGIQGGDTWTTIVLTTEEWMDLF